MTKDEIIAFHDSIRSFAVPTHEETRRINALDPEDRTKLLAYLLEVGRESGVYEGSMEDVRREARAKLAAKIAAE